MPSSLCQKVTLETGRKMEELPEMALVALAGLAHAAPPTAPVVCTGQARQSSQGCNGGLAGKEMRMGALAEGLGACYWWVGLSGWQ